MSSTSVSDAPLAQTMPSDAAASMAQGFFHWLSKKSPARTLSQLQNVCRDLDVFCTRYKVLDRSLFDKITIDELDRVKSAVTSNEILHHLHQNQMPFLRTAVEFYCIYLHESQDTMTETYPPAHIPCAVPPPPPPRPLPPAHTDDAVDLTEITIEQYANTKPKRLFYKSETYDITVWARLYTQIARSIYGENPDAVKALLGKSLSGAGNRIDIADRCYKTMMKTPKEIADGIYLETHLSATNTVRKIKYLLDLCGIDYSDVTITYTPARQTVSLDADITSDVQDHQSHRAAPISSPPMYTEELEESSAAAEETDAPPTVSITAYALTEPPQEGYLPSYYIPLPKPSLRFGHSSIPISYMDSSQSAKT